MQWDISVGLSKTREKIKAKIWGPCVLVLAMSPLLCPPSDRPRESTHVRVHVRACVCVSAGSHCSFQCQTTTTEYILVFFIPMFGTPFSVRNLAPIIFNIFIYLISLLVYNQSALPVPPSASTWRPSWPCSSPDVLLWFMVALWSPLPPPICQCPS